MEEEIINLLKDPNFKLWVQVPNETNDRFWNQIIQNHPERTDPILKARLILEALNREFKVDFPDQEVVEMVLRKIFAENKL